MRVFILSFVLLIGSYVVHPVYGLNSRFEKALMIVLEHEGYLSDDKNDKGGITKYGLSLRFLKLEKLDIDGDGDVDRDDVLKLTRSKADTIYLQKFWLANHYDRISDIRVATKLFDMAVNAGSSRSTKLLKLSINSVLKEQLPITPTLDNATISIANCIEPVLLLDELRAQQAKFYRDIVKKNPQYRIFAKGWANRAAW